MSVLINNYKSELANYLNVKESHITLFWKGRVALYALLKSFGISKDDEVILPAFTCVVVPNAILYCDAKPVYVDINPQTLNCDPEEIRKKITPKTKLIIAQNTFGLSSDLDAIMRIANEYHIVVIEDCTHGIGGYYRGIKNLFEIYLPMVDVAIIYDNSFGNPEFIAEKAINSKIKILNKVKFDKLVNYGK